MTDKLTPADLEAILYRVGRPADTQRIRDMYGIGGIDLEDRSNYEEINRHNQKVNEIMERSYNALDKIRKLLWND